MKKRLNTIIAVILLVTSFVFTGCSKKVEPTDSSKVESRINEYKDVDFLISADELKDILGNKDVLLFDCNKPEVYEKGHIPGAVNIGLQTFTKSEGKIGEEGWGTIVDRQELAKRLKKLGIDNKKTIVFYSDTSKGPGADGRAVWQLRMAGMDNVKFLNGGLTYWNEKGYETTKEPSEAVPTTEEVVLKDYDTHNSTTKEELYKNLGKETVIDVRTEKEYKGSQDVGEPRGGHIKGAEHMLWQELMYPNGVIKSKEEIKKIMVKHNVKPEDTFCVY